MTKQTDIYRYCVFDLRQNEICAKSKDCCAWPHCHCVYSGVGVWECLFHSKWGNLKGMLNKYFFCGP